jgi:hypothetical protein
MPSTPKAKDVEEIKAQENTAEETAGPRGDEDVVEMEVTPPSGATLYRWIGDYPQHFTDPSNSDLAPSVAPGGYVTLNIDGSDPLVSEFWNAGLLIDATGVTPPTT